MDRLSSTDKKWTERLYDISVIIKGFDGIAELLSGMMLLFAPNLLHNLLSGLVLEFSESRSHQFIADYIGRLDYNIAHAGLTVLIIFLITHGIVKIALVYALIKKIIKAYPYALITLAIFLIYQVYVFIIKPTLGAGLFALLDAAIIYFVWREWRMLLENRKNISS